MKPAGEMSSTHQSRETWLPLLQLATEEVFDIMLGSKLEPVAEAPAARPSGITSMVGLAGQLCGVLTLCCSFPTAAMMASKMLGVEPDQADQQMWDAIGEICNKRPDLLRRSLQTPCDPALL